MNDTIWAKEISEKIKSKMEKVASRSQGIIPYTTENGRFDDWTEKNVCWWTNGFWGGMMWQLYHATKLELYKDIALENERKLDFNLMNTGGLDHDNGFKWLPTSVAHYRLTKDEASKNRGLLAANNLAGRFNLAGSFIRAWNDCGDGNNAGWAIIDCMMNLPLLYWASNEINDPRFNHIAKAHADMAAKYFVREDGSVNHIVEFNPSTGEFVKTYGGQGYAEGSTWTRGQSWAVYGFTLSYLHTKKPEYLETAKKVADYYIAHIPESGLIPVDFCQPTDCTLEDSTSAAIAACGLLELEKFVEGELKQTYHNAAMKLLRTLAEQRFNQDETIDNLLEKCTAAFHDDKHEFSIIYGDYYFIEAIFKLTGEELFIW
ncbi:glycoside hydrolase family 88 protein [Anaerosporobacter sp.]|uniref:glycoside hydrolase family 88 protein n=1 Tax=Anaerosporobacter sp. TaxID=1872529 RepID=UPI00286F9A9A|nr:glycoside hydrolase family 88 protein [Anaerosporobacter sp.]